MVLFITHTSSLLMCLLKFFVFYWIVLLVLNSLKKYIFETFPTQGSNLHLLSPPALAVGLLTTSTTWEAPLIRYVI